MLAHELDFHARLKAHVAAWLESDAGKREPYAQLVALAPDLFHLLCRGVADDTIPAEQRARLGSAIAYFVIPADLIPEGVAGPRGYLDDVAVAAAALSKVEPAALEKHWDAEGTAADALRTVLDNAESALGDAAIWKKLQGLVE